MWELESTLLACAPAAAHIGRFLTIEEAARLLLTRRTLLHGPAPIRALVKASLAEGGCSAPQRIACVLQSRIRDGLTPRAPPLPPPHHARACTLRSPPSLPLSQRPTPEQRVDPVVWCSRFRRARVRPRSSRLDDVAVI